MATGSLLGWLVGDETDALHLAVVVESDEPDEGVAVLGLAGVELLHDRDGVSGRRSTVGTCGSHGTRIPPTGQKRAI